MSAFTFATEITLGGKFKTNLRSKNSLSCVYRAIGSWKVNFFTAFVTNFPPRLLSLVPCLFFCLPCFISFHSLFFQLQRNDQAGHQKHGFPLSVLDTCTHAHTCRHTHFTSGLVFNFMSKSGQEAPVQLKSCKQEKQSEGETEKKKGGKEKKREKNRRRKRKTLIHLLWKYMSQSSHQKQCQQTERNTNWFGKGKSSEINTNFIPSKCYRVCLGGELNAGHSFSPRLRGLLITDL